MSKKRTKKFVASKYSDAIADEICARLAAGEHFNDILKKVKIDRMTIWKWSSKNIRGFAAKYCLARKLQIEHYLDSALDTAYDATDDLQFDQKTGKMTRGSRDAVQRARLKVDTVKWAACKLIPKLPALKGRLGEMTQNVFNGVQNDGLPLERAEQIMGLLESSANIKKVDEFEELAQQIPTMQKKLSEFEAMCIVDQSADVKDKKADSDTSKS